jgi:hypothetical protein
MFKLDRLKSLLVVAVLSALAVGIGACGSDSSDTTVTQTKTVREPAPDTSSPQKSSGGGTDSGGGSGQRWTMPDLTGNDLQGAQDAIQSLTNGAIFFTDSHDASGQGRNQILDRGWQVCTQDPAPGSKINPDTNIDFGVVRETEQCP